MAFSPNGSILASSDQNDVKLWNSATGEHLNTLKGHTSIVKSLSFSPDGKTLGSGSWDTTIRLWDVPIGEHKKTLTGHKHWVYSVSFSRDGKTLASAAVDGTVLLWDIASITNTTDSIQ